jgi:hypothetical protein
MQQRTIGYGVAALAVVAGFAAGCSVNSSECTGQASELVGTYDLLAYDVGSTTYQPPDATGVLRLHAGSYALAIVLPGPSAVSDTGTYTVCGSSGFNQQSITGRAQFSGIYILAGDTLSLAGQSAGSIWLARP